MKNPAAVAWNSNSWTFEALEARYHTPARYRNLRDQGMALGRGCGTPSMAESSQYPNLAYELGKSMV